MAEVQLRQSPHPFPSCQRAPGESLSLQRRAAAGYCCEISGSQRLYTTPGGGGGHTGLESPSREQDNEKKIIPDFLFPKCPQRKGIKGSWGSGPGCGFNGLLMSSCQKDAPSVQSLPFLISPRSQHSTILIE